MKKLFLIFSLFCSVLNAQQVNFNLKETPFSCKGSWMSLSTYPENEKGEVLYLRDNCGRRMWKNNGVFRLELIHNGSSVNSTYETSAEMITMKSSNGITDLAFESSNVLRIRGKGTSLRLTLTAPYDGSSLVIPVAKGQWRLQMGGFPHFVFTTIKGDAQLNKGSRFSIQLVNDKFEKPQIEMVIDISPDKDGFFEAAIENYSNGWSPKTYTKSFEACVDDVKKDFIKWCELTPKPLKQYEQAWYLANYINWSCVVEPRGLITTPMMLSSKNNMHAVWTWDTWFYGIATSYIMPEYAWTSSNTIYMKHQDSLTGALPNLTTDVDLMWGFGYPAIWGWSIRKMIEHNAAIGSIMNLRQLYPHLCKATDYWFNYKDDDKDGLPQYDHMNDSGMDNSSAGDIGMSIEAPDLAAYLVIQMEVLSEIAAKLNKTEESKKWKQRSDVLLKKMIDSLWNGNHFVAHRTDDNKYNEKSQSILLYMPLILGKKLPSEISTKMINDLKTKGFFTQVGLCSENPKGSLYVEDSYWRGPVWSPPTLIIASGIKECGDNEFAKEIAKRYCDNCVKNGFGENFDPFTGASLKDKSLPWTSAIFIIMMEDFLK